MQQLTNHSQLLFFSKRFISHWDFCFVFSCLLLLAAGFAVFVATIFWIFIPIAGIGVQLLANSLSLIMAHSTTTSLSSAEPTRPGLQQRSLTNALVSISFNINLSKISLSLRVQVCQPTKAWCSSKDDCLLEPRLSSSSQRGDYLQVRCWTTLQQVWIWPQAHVKNFVEHCRRNWFWIHCFSCFGLIWEMLLIIVPPKVNYHPQLKPWPKKW